MDGGPCLQPYLAPRSILLDQASPKITLVMAKGGKDQVEWKRGQGKVKGKGKSKGKSKGKGKVKGRKKKKRRRCEGEANPTRKTKTRERTERQREIERDRTGQDRSTDMTYAMRFLFCLPGQKGRKNIVISLCWCVFVCGMDMIGGTCNGYLMSILKEQGWGSWLCIVSSCIVHRLFDVGPQERQRAVNWCDFFVWLLSCCLKTTHATRASLSRSSQPASQPAHGSISSCFPIWMVE
ncbi:MAG: hypothetical protein BYD32DRAFT_41574 [Podila humilis]|nr:MAG: hypothetical protein BYD32DRAFT_41574 [Podila humilis]